MLTHPTDRRILLIEDNEMNLELMVYLLQEFGYTPRVANNGETGLQIIKKERPHLVLCDIQLPKLDGYELAQQVKADPELRETLVVAVTAMAMVGDREKSLAAGFDGYISKPIEAQTFVQQVENFLKSRGRAKPAGHIPDGQPHPPPKKGLVLAVDDIMANNKLLESLLEPFGYQVIIASGMTEAMALAREHLPTLIISDVRMHEGSGFELCEAIKTDPRLKQIPFILLTSTYCNETARAKGLALGAAKYIFRPIESQALLREIEACLPTARP